MRGSRLALFGLASAGVLVLLVPACLGPTQVTLDIQKDPQTKCEDLHETSIVVAVEPLDAESRVDKNFVTATTQACDPVTNKIGTLVVTPGGAHRASIVVVVASGGKKASAQCRPNEYGDCIIARRRFSFSDHEQLHMPVTLDIDCRGKPCDAYSTCRKGLCFDSETSANSGGGTEPGATEDGGTDPTIAVKPDAAQPADDASSDAKHDAALDGGGSKQYCAPGDVLHCPSVVDESDVVCGTATPIGGNSSCCDGPNGAHCGPPCPDATQQRCCTNADCPPSWTCGTVTDEPAHCSPPATIKDAGTDGPVVDVYCDMFKNLVCAGVTQCNGLTSSCCQGAGGLVCRATMQCMMGETKYCCDTARDCPPPIDGGTAKCILPAGQLPAGGTVAGTCQ